ncbi:MAG: hypothetical protein IPP40_10355 [bacterium]|nr:hypothetical protein [bacterium]
MQNIAASENYIDRVVLGWHDVYGETGYIISRDFSPIATVAANQTSYVDFSETSEVAYEYSVQATSACDTSEMEYSDVGMRTCGELAPPIVTIGTDGDDAILNWTVVDTTVLGCPVDVTIRRVFL